MLAKNVSMEQWQKTPCDTTAQWLLLQIMQYHIKYAKWANVTYFALEQIKKRKAKYVAKKGPSFVSGPLKIRRFCSGWLIGESGESRAMQRESVWKKGRQSYTMQAPDLTCTVPHQPKKLVF